MKHITAFTLFLIGFLYAACAIAADVVYTIDVQPTIQGLIGYVFAAIGGLATGLLIWLFDPNTGKLAKLKVDESIRAYLETAIYAGLQYAENKALDYGRDLKNPATNKEIIAIAANYILPRVPDALKHFGIDETDLRDMIIARFKPASGASSAGVSQ